MSWLSVIFWVGLIFGGLLAGIAFLAAGAPDYASACFLLSITASLVLREEPRG